MDERLRTLRADLQAMDSEAAADWLLANCPVGSPRAGDAVTLIPRLSWARPDQDRLSRHYLSGIPHANDVAYRALLQVMSVRRFLATLSALGPPADPSRDDLLFYYLTPALRRAARSAKDNQIIDRFLAAWRTP